MGVVVDILALALQACVALFTAGSLAGAGLAVSVRDALTALAHGRFVAIALLASWLVCPAAALLVVHTLPLERAYANGLLVLALAPCAPFAPALVRAARGDAAHLAAFVILSAVGTVVVMPVVLPWMIGGAPVDPVAIARPLLVLVLLPLAAGLALRELRPRAAARAAIVAGALTRAMTGALVVLVAVLYGRGVLDAIGSYAIAAQIAFAAVVALAVHGLGRGLSDDERSVLTIGLSTRNLGAALAPLAAIDVDPRATVMVAIAIPVTLAGASLAAYAITRRPRGPRVLSHPRAA
jgi:BASS family bile acid:Na+ symporter